METIKINHGDQAYGIESIMPVSKHVLQVVFNGPVPESFGDIGVYTSGGIQCASLKGYSTVYRDEGQTVYLSNDGSVYQPPDETGGGLPPDPYVPTPEELLQSARESRRNEVSSACERAIYKGVSVTLGDGTVGHFSLTEHDQINLFGKQAQLAAGAEQVEYHADGKPCRYYSAADMEAIIEAARFHVGYHTAYCNSLNMWIAGCREVEEVRQVFYGADVPDGYRSDVLNDYLAQIVAMAD